MKSLQRMSIALVVAVTMMVIPVTTWAGRDETAAYLFNAALNQAELLYYAGSGEFYAAYSYAGAAYQNLYAAWQYAPWGSAMESWAATAYQYAYQAQTYWAYTYVYGWDYYAPALYSSYVAQRYTAYAQYGAAFYF
jgi:hypothetical protein